MGLGAWTSTYPIRVGRPLTMLLYLPNTGIPWSSPFPPAPTSLVQPGLEDSTATAPQAFPTWATGAAILDLQEKSRPQQAWRTRSPFSSLEPGVEVTVRAGSVLDSSYASEPRPPSQALGGRGDTVPRHQHPLLTACTGLHWSMGLLKSVLNSSKAMI